MCKWCHYICVDAVNHFRLHPTTILYIYNVWAPSDVVDRHMDASSHYTQSSPHTVPPVGSAAWKQQVCHGRLKMMPLHLCWGHKPLQAASYIYRIHYMYKVFEHFLVMWIDIWIHPHITITTTNVDADFWVLAKNFDDWPVQMMPLHLCCRCKYFKLHPTSMSYIY